MSDTWISPALRWRYGRYRIRDENEENKDSENNLLGLRARMHRRRVQKKNKKK